MASPLSSVIQFMDSSWNPILQPYISNTPSFDKLKKFLEEEYKTNTIFPPCEQVWSWSIVPFEDIKVVILGQDPYHGPGQANGLAFSVAHGVRRLPPSLRNIYKELARDVPRFEIPSHGNLKGWVKQGVLLLNSTLTVRKATAGSHKNKGWEDFTDYVIQKISDERRGVVFMLWGDSSKQKEPLVDQSKHLVLKSSHPSPLSYYRGFQGCGHFSLCNAYLDLTGSPMINWGILPEHI